MSLLTAARDFLLDTDRWLERHRFAYHFEYGGWSPLSPGCELEYRGVVTLNVLTKPLVFTENFRNWEKL